MTFLTVLFLLLFSGPLAEAQQYGWVRVAQLGNPNFTSLGTVEFVDSLHGWLYGDLPAGYQYTVDGGNTWMPSTSPGFASSSISMLDTLRGWAVGNGVNEGGVARTTDGGHTWIQQRLRLDRRYYGTASLTLAKNITSGSTFNDTGKVVQTTDGGTTWTERTIGSNIQQLRKVQFVDSLHGWITVFGPGGVLRTTDGGQSWVHASTAPLFNAISFLDTLKGWAIEPNQAFVYSTSDAGSSWVRLGRVEDPMWGNITPSALSFVDTLNGWAFGTMFFQGDAAAAIFRTTDGGLSWAREFVGGGSRRLLDAKMLDRYHGWAVGDFGNVFAYRLLTSVPEHLAGVPTSFALHQNYPNPFNTTTSIEYEVLQSSNVTITAYDVSGKEVAVLVNSDHEAGAYRVIFDGRNLASGVYYYTMKTPSFTTTRQMTLLK